MEIAAPAAVPVTPDVAAGVRTLRGGGRPLAEPVRHQLERATGSRLAHVRIHDDPLAHALSSAVSAQAFTVGNDIALGAGASPGVLAHEVAHAAQLSAAPSGGSFAATRPGDAIEQAAGG